MPMFPSDLLRAQSCNISSETITNITEYGFNTSVAKRGNPHRWSINMVTPPLNEEQARRLTAFLDSLDGRYTTFTMGSPLKFLSGVTSFKTSGSGHIAGSNEIVVKDLPVNMSDILKAGDFIKFSNHDKVYKIVENADSSAVGFGTMIVVPRLFKDVPNDTVVSEAVFSCRMTKDKVSLSLDARKGLYPVMITAVENE